jgi:hypothetical protein
MIRSPAATRAAALPLVALALAKVAVEWSVIGDYGYLRDELYMLACSERLEWGYVDHAPLSVFALAAVRALFGDSLVAIRVLPALAGAVTLLLAGSTALALGGGALAAAIAGTAMLAAPLFLALDHAWTPNAFDLLFWTLAARLVVALLSRPSSGRWIALGLVFGLGALNKPAILALVFGLVMGLLATPDREQLRTRGALAALLIVAALLAPYAMWQAEHGWPTLAFMAAPRQDRLAISVPLEFAASQILSLNPASTPIWIAGLVWLLSARDAGRWRALGVMWLVTCGLIVMNQTSRAQHLGAAFPLLFAAGGVALERVSARPRLAWLGPTAAALAAATGAAMAPLAVPLLPVERYLEYTRRLGIELPRATPSSLPELPPFFADMHGWEEIAAAVTLAYESLSPEERAKVVILATNTGEAGAIDLFGRRAGLPPASSGHNGYWLWGPRAGSGEIVIALADSRRTLAAHYARVQEVGRVECGYCMPWERRKRVWIAREPRRPLLEIWPTLKRYV